MKTLVLSLWGAIKSNPRSSLCKFTLLCGTVVQAACLALIAAVFNLASESPLLNVSPAERSEALVLVSVLVVISLAFHAAIILSAYSLGKSKGAI